MFSFSDIMNFSHDELLEEYYKLFDRYQDLRQSNEADTQKIHELKRSLDTATAAQAYLSQELEQYTNSENNKIEDELHRTQVELTEVKKKYGKLETSFANLQQDYNLLLEENSKMSENLVESLKRREQLPTEVDTKICDDYLLRIQALENENMDLLEKIGDFQEQSVRYTLTIAECEKNIEILRDKIVCLEENLQSKRIDMEEKLQIIESTQEQLAEANAKIAMLSSAPDNKDRKGNSLFAEVDDQRQAMRQLLTVQKKSYIEMKKIYQESEHEIRRLKRENISMHTELEACSTIFCNADKIYQEKLNERIRNLLNQNEDLERKLKWTQERLKELADGNGVLFLDSMFNFCKKETDDLKSQLHSVRIQKACLEEQLRNAQQNMARWRFESLKSRCILIDREDLLTENKIAFKPIHAVEYNISEKEQEVAEPRIVTKRGSSIFENIFERKSITPSKVPTKQEMESPQQNSVEENSIPNTLNIKNENKLSDSTDTTTNLIKNEEKTSDKKELTCAEKLPTALEEVKPEKLNKIELTEIRQQNITDNKANSSVSTIDDVRFSNKFAKLKSMQPSPMRPSQKSTQKTSVAPARSILTKQNDLLFKDSCKNVKFSSNEDIIPESSSPPSTTNSANNKLNIKGTVKQSCTKSNIVVRRIVVNSKHD